MKLAYDGPGWPEVVLADFAPAPGGKGFAEVGRLVEERGAVADPDADWSARVATRLLRELLAQLSGDVWACVDVLAEELDRPDQCLKIVVVLRDNQRAGEALAWTR